MKSLVDFLNESRDAPQTVQSIAVKQSECLAEELAYIKHRKGRQSMDMKRLAQVLDGQPQGALNESDDDLKVVYQVASKSLKLPSSFKVKTLYPTTRNNYGIEVEVTFLDNTGNEDSFGECNVFFQLRKRETKWRYQFSSTLFGINNENANRQLAKLANVKKALDATVKALNNVEVYWQ